MNDYAVVLIGSQQYRVQLGDILEVDKLESSGKTLTFDKVLMHVSGQEIKIGQPYLKGITVDAKVLEEEKKGEKLRIFRYKAKSRFRRTQGQRSSYTVLEITALAGKKLSRPRLKPSSKLKKSTKKPTAKKPVSSPKR